VSLKYALLATEGADDQAVLCRLLKLMGFVSFAGDGQNLDLFWLDLIPRLPKMVNTAGSVAGGNLYAYKNLPFPYFFTSPGYSIAVYQGQGSRLAQNLLDITQAYKAYARDIYALGIIIDADTYNPADVAKNYAEKLQSSFPSLRGTPGIVAPGPPRSGIYVLPDNNRPGNLDTVLVNCASCVYPEHKAGAEQFLQNLDARHKTHWSQPYGKDKALVASIVSIVRPGKANHNSLASANDRWISQQTLGDVPEIAQLYHFLQNLLELS
jgi:hypothetical protein